MAQAPLNPFRFGTVVVDEFADRTEELAEVEADMRNGQDLVHLRARVALGKSSLVLKAAAGIRRKKGLVAYLNLMTAPNKTRLAERLAAAIYADIAAPKAKFREKALAMFRGLRIAPTVIVDPLDGRLSFSFGIGHPDAELDRAIEMLLELPRRSPPNAISVWCSSSTSSRRSWTSILTSRSSSDPSSRHSPTCATCTSAAKGT